MWKAINYGCAVSDDDIKVKVGRNYVSYTDGDYATRIDRRVISTEPYVMVIDFSYVTDWFPPHQHDVISAEQKNKMIEKIAEAMRVLGEEDKLNYHEVDIKENKIIVTLTRKNFLEIHEQNKEFLEGIKQKLSKI